jgi:TPR repeat protein
MFNILNDCLKEFESLKKQSCIPLSDFNGSQNKEYIQLESFSRRSRSINQSDTYVISTNVPDFESFNYMTLTEAAKQHKLINKSGKCIGDIRTAYKCFDAYANLTKTSMIIRNHIKAKYYKAYYISRGLVDSPKDKDKIVAELFREVADDEVNEFPDAKVRYGDCLYNGKGVKQDLAKALEYFEKAADDGIKEAMYNTGKLYWNGICGTKNIEKATHYLKLAAYNEYEPAIKFCKEHNIML